MSNNIVITGANRGIGLALCAEFKAQGDRVFALCRKSSAELAALDVNIIENIGVATDLGIRAMVSALSHIDITLHELYYQCNVNKKTYFCTNGKYWSLRQPNIKRRLRCVLTIVLYNPNL